VLFEHLSFSAVESPFCIHACGKGGGGKSRGGSCPSYPANKPSKTGGKSGGGRSNAPAKSMSGKSFSKGK